MSLFSKAINWVAGEADDLFGTQIFGKTVESVGGFLGDVREFGQETGITDYVTSRFGGDGEYKPFATPDIPGSTAGSRVATTAGTYRSTAADKYRGTGMNNPAVQRAWQKALQNPRIQASIEVVRPTIGKRGPTKSLREAQIKVS